MSMLDATSNHLPCPVYHDRRTSKLEIVNINREHYFHVGVIINTLPIRNHIEAKFLDFRSPLLPTTTGQRMTVQGKAKLANRPTVLRSPTGGPLFHRKKNPSVIAQELTLSEGFGGIGNLNFVAGERTVVIHEFRSTHQRSRTLHFLEMAQLLS